MSAPFGKLSSRLRRVLSSILAGVGFASSSFHDSCYANRNVGYKLGEDGVSRKCEYNRDEKLENRRRRVKKGKDSSGYSKILHKIKDNKILTTVEVGSLIGAGIFIKKTFFGSNDVYDVSKSIIKKCLKSGKTLGADEWYDKLVEKDKCVKNVEEYNNLVKKSYEEIDKASLEQIEKDLNRSMVPKNYIEFLRDILVAYCVRNKHGYLQGFNDIASFVIRKFIGVELTDESRRRFGEYKEILSAQEKLKVYCVFEAIMGIYRRYLKYDEGNCVDVDFAIEISRLMCDKFIRNNKLQSFFGDVDYSNFVSIYTQINLLRFLSHNSQITFWDYLVSMIPENGKFDVDKAFQEIFNLFLALSFRADELNLGESVYEIPIVDNMFFVSQGNEEKLKLDEIT